MDLWILFAAAWIGKIRVSFWRIVLGACISSLMALTVFLPGVGESFGSWYGKVMMSILITRITFPWKNIRTGLKQLAYFYLASLLTGGVVLAMSFFGGNTFGNLQVVNDHFTWGINLGLVGMFGALPMVYLLVDLLFRAKRAHSVSNERLQVEICINDRKTVVWSIVDTGNSLTDPLSHQPVSICTAAAILSILPESLRMLYENGEDPILQLGKRAIAEDFESRLRIIPYRGVGGGSGMLLAFKPDGWWILTENKRLPLEGLIALQTGSLSASEQYQMILHPDALPSTSQNLPAAELKGAISA